MAFKSLLKLTIFAVVAMCASSYYCQPRSISGVRPALAARRTVAVLNLHPNQAAALEEAAEEYIKSCHADDDGYDDATHTGRRFKSSGTTKTGATASNTPGAKPTSSFAFARTLLSRVTSRPQPPFTSK